MQKQEYKDLSLQELLEMRGNLSKFIDKRLEERRKKAIQTIQALVQEHSLTYEEVVQVVRTTTKRGKAPALYRNPENPRQTWSGKGNPPAWYAQAKNLDELRIPGA